MFHKIFNLSNRNEEVATYWARKDFCNRKIRCVFLYMANFEMPFRHQSRHVWIVKYKSVAPRVSTLDMVGSHPIGEHMSGNPRKQKERLIVNFGFTIHRLLVCCPKFFHYSGFWIKAWIERETWQTPVNQLVKGNITNNGTSNVKWLLTDHLEKSSASFAW